MPSTRIGYVTRCIDADTGEIKWEEVMEMGQLLVANGKLIILERYGTLHIAEATPSSYKEISNGHVYESENKKGKFWTPPVLYKGKLYCRDQYGYLICIDVSK